MKFTTSVISASAVSGLHLRSCLCERKVASAELAKRAGTASAVLKPLLRLRSSFCGFGLACLGRICKRTTASAVSHLRLINCMCGYDSNLKLQLFPNFSTSLEPRPIDARGSRAPPEHTDKSEIIKRTCSNLRNARNNAKSKNHPLKPIESNL